MFILRKALLSLLLILAIVTGFWVVIDNPEPVVFRLLGFTLSTLPLGMWALLAFLLGCVAGMLVSVFPLRRSQ